MVLDLHDRRSDPQVGLVDGDCMIGEVIRILNDDTTGLYRTAKRANLILKVHKSVVLS